MDDAKKSKFMNRAALIFFGTILVLAINMENVADGIETVRANIALKKTLKLCVSEDYEVAEEVYMQMYGNHMFDPNWKELHSYVQAMQAIKEGNEKEIAWSTKTFDEHGYDALYKVLGGKGEKELLSREADYLKCGHEILDEKGCVLKGCYHLRKEGSNYCYCHKCSVDGCPYRAQVGTLCKEHAERAKNAEERKEQRALEEKKQGRTSGSGKTYYSTDEIDPDDYDLDGYYEDYKDEFEDYDDAYDDFLDHDEYWDDY
ncbi:MAG: hypothetical protein K6G07_02190 [Lachnospiraceae bacterium]|nr:hypothetical protein [Lachnospiraceae bacterium]